MASGLIPPVVIVELISLTEKIWRPRARGGFSNGKDHLSPPARARAGGIFPTENNWWEKGLLKTRAVINSCAGYASNEKKTVKKRAPELISARVIRVKWYYLFLISAIQISPSNELDWPRTIFISWNQTGRSLFTTRDSREYSNFLKWMNPI